MRSKQERALVRQFFETDAYLASNPNIAVRSLLVRRLLDRVDACSILDVGCGDGSLSLQFLPAARHISLLDLSEKMLERAGDRIPEPYARRVAFVNGDIVDFQPDQLYDIVLCIGVLAHVGLVEAVLQKLSDSLAPEGRCIVEISDYSRPLTKALYAYARARDSIRRSRRYSLTTMTASEVIDAAAHAGLRLAARENYSFQLPGTGLLPERWRLRLEKFALGHPRLAAHGAQTLLLFVKKDQYATDRLRTKAAGNP